MKPAIKRKPSRPRIRPLDRALVRRAFELRSRRDRFLCVAKAAGLSELSALRLWSLVQ